MSAAFKNRFVYLSLSLVLLIVAFPMISMGTTRGPSWLWWIGLVALCGGGLLPPLYRLLWGAASAPPQPDEVEDDSRRN